MVRLPIGIQDFTKLREDGYIYVDKTMFMQPFLAGGAYFLSRPRRFGKSLLLSTLKAVFEGKKDLFKDLWLEQQHDFKIHPIIRLDFSQLDFQAQTLEQAIVRHFQNIAKDYKITLISHTAKSIFEEFIQALSHLGKVVVLIDEYDKPITDYLLEAEKRTEHQNVLKSLYGVLKPMDQYLHLVFLTGVSKIGKLSLFSDLNNLQDISLNADYATLCGYNREEMELAFPDYLQNAANKQKITLEELWEQLKFWYNGYSWDAINSVYCPFSFLLFLAQPQFKSFWYETGTPTFLLHMIRNAQLNPLEFDSLEVSEKVIVATDIDRLDPISLMFQTGYLTVKSIANNPKGTLFELHYPNEEVRQAFSSNLLLEYSTMLPHQADQLGLELQRALIRLDWIAFFAAVNRTFAGIPYEIFPRQEAYGHSLLHLMLVSTGFSTQSQVQTSLGRMDILVQTFTHSIIFEIKIGGTPQEALQQINEKHYADMLQKPVVKIGVVFDLERKQISDWKVT